MTLDQLWNMVLRIFIRKGVNWGIAKGMGQISAAGRKPSGPRGASAPAEAAQARQARDLARRARKAARLTRRIGR